MLPGEGCTECSQMLGSCSAEGNEIAFPASMCDEGMCSLVAIRPSRDKQRDLRYRTTIARLEKASVLS